LKNSKYKWLLIVNYFAVFVFIISWVSIYWVISLNAPLRVTELDRAQVINEVKLREFNTVLAENIRGNLGRWIVEEESNAAIHCSLFGVAVGLINIFLLHFSKRNVVLAKKIEKEVKE
jgi:hypothetical protein